MQKLLLVYYYIVYQLLLRSIRGVQCMTTKIWILSCVNYCYYLDFYCVFKRCIILVNALQYKNIEIVSHYFILACICDAYDHWLLSLCLVRPVPWLV